MAGGIFLLTYFYFNALENPQTFLFYRHIFPAALSLLTIRQRQSSRVVGSGLSNARIFQGFCTSMLCGQRSCLRPGLLCWLQQLRLVESEADRNSVSPAAAAASQWAEPNSNHAPAWLWTLCCMERKPCHTARRRESFLQSTLRVGKSNAKINIH